MESEKVKEIKKVLECCANWNGRASCNDCPIGVKKCFEEENLMPKLALTLINELESENERLNKSDTLKEESSIEYYNLYKDLKRKNKDLNELCELQRVSIAESFVRENQLKDRIAELEKENARLLDSVETVQNGRCAFKCELTKKQLKQFAERLKKKFNKQEERFATDVTRFESDLDKVKEVDLPTAKYLIGKATGQATMAEKSQYYIDETLKEFIND